MPILDSATVEKLKQFQKRSTDKKTWENKILSDKEIIILVARLLPVTNSLTLIEALKSDLRSSQMWDAVGFWCDPDKGLAKQFPNQILEIAEKLLPKEETEA